MFSVLAEAHTTLLANQSKKKECSRALGIKILEICEAELAGSSLLTGSGTPDTSAVSSSDDNCGSSRLPNRDAWSEIKQLPKHHSTQKAGIRNQWGAHGDIVQSVF